MEEARRLAEEMKRQQYELEMRLRFNRSLQLESTGLSQTQDITRAFVFSYFELLQWLGLDVPDFETWKKMQSYQVPNNGGFWNFTKAGQFMMINELILLDAMEV